LHSILKLGFFAPSRTTFLPAKIGLTKTKHILVPALSMTRLRMPLMKIEVVPAASEQVPVLANLLQLYAHDFSEFHDLEIGADGSFVYEHLPLYWSEPGRPPFLVWVDNELGFVLVKKGSETSGNGHVWDMAEFFVLRAYRRRRVGTRIAYEVWKRFPGVWEVRVMQANAAALNFWTRAISEFTGKNIDPVRFGKDGESWMLFCFASTHLA